MADITRRRTGELLQIVFDLLKDQPEGLAAKEILDKIPQKTTLTEYEKGSFPSTPDTPRYEKILRFATIDLVKAGWLVKEKGCWYITPEGEKAYKSIKEPELFYKEAVRLYQVWKRSRAIGVIDVPGGGDDVVVNSLTVEEAEERAWEEIKGYLQKMNPYHFQNLVADLLRAMDYHVAWVSPPGKDKGIDIIAYTDPLGATIPRIKVQVKRREQAVTVEGLRAFLSVLGTNDVGLFVSAGGFTSDAKDEARTQEFRKITLLDLENLNDLWIEHYGKLTQEAKQRFPLKPVYFLAPNE